MLDFLASDIAYALGLIMIWGILGGAGLLGLATMIFGLRPSSE